MRSKTSKAGSSIHNKPTTQQTRSISATIWSGSKYIRHIDDTTESTVNDSMNRGQEIRAEKGHGFYKTWAKQIRGGLDPAKEQEALKHWNEREDG